jgi:tRNA threonylcarbamoyladenosine biosynthesis protein TsaB
VGSFTLAIETSGVPASLAIAADGMPTIEDRIEGDRPDVGRLLVLRIDALLARAGRERAELRRVVVGVGPGSYTALRIGAAAARTLAFAAGASLAAFPSTLAIAARALERAPEDRVLVLLDALRGDFAVAIYARGERVPRELRAPEIRHGNEIAALASGGICLVSDRPEVAAPFLPAGAAVLRSEPSAATLLALDLAGATPLERAVPLYLRASAAEERLRSRP